MDRNKIDETTCWRVPEPRNGGAALPKTLLLAAAGIGLIISVIAGCRRNEAPKASPAADKQSHTYIVRGVIENLPSPNAHPRLLMVHMETINKFYQPNGKPTKMSAMTMPFPLAKSVSTASLKVREKVRMTLVVDWPKNINHVTKITPLPPSTHPRLSAPKPAGGMSATMPGM